MKTDTRYYLGWAARGRLVGRVLGLTGLFAGLAGLFIFLALGREPTIDAVQAALSTSGTEQVAAWLIVAGGAVAALILIVELLSWLAGSGRRSATGANSAVQIVLAVAIVVALNVVSFGNFKRWDLTREQEFTLPTQVADELRKLQGRTTIVVLQQHKTFGQLSPKPDIYDYAAERKVVDKVHDLVDQFRLLGPQFRVVTLDVEAIGYSDQLEAETIGRPGLKEAIESAPDNSIFFYPDDRVETIARDESRRRTALGRRLHSQPVKGKDDQVNAYEGNIPRLSFNEFYQLDKSASKAANPGPDGKPGGNLVLRPQGVESFAQRILAIQEKRPKVGLLVIHELLTSAKDTTDRNVYTSAGLRKSLEDRGFEVVDVVVKKWGEPGGPKPAAYNLTETQFERYEAELEGFDEQRRDLLENREEVEAAQKIYRETPLEELKRKLRGARVEVTEEFRQKRLKAIAEALKQIDERLAELAQDRRDTDAQMAALSRNERAFEDKRVTDIKNKLTRLVADCDLLIVPRLTVLNASSVNENITPELYRLSTEQVEVLKEFMKTGKPVMVCAGPNAEPNVAASPDPLDDVERLLADRGVQLGCETIITTAEAKSFAARRAGDQFGGASTELPTVTFPSAPPNGRDNPIAAAMRATAASADQQLVFVVQDPRPVYLAAGMSTKLPFAAEFLLSPTAAWNEEKPMIVRNIGGRVIQLPPRFQPTPFDDPKKGTPDEVRRGPFSIGVAIEAPIPVEWFDKDYGGVRGTAALTNRLDAGLLAACLTAKAALSNDRDTKALVPQTERKTGRLVVIGHGGIFTGKQLSPAHEQLLLHTTNWLLNRDDRLPRTSAEWSYPRVHRDERDSFLWKYGPFLGLPAFFLYLGLIVWIVRRVR